MSGPTLGRLLPLRRTTGRSEELSDEALLAACGVGDNAALGALFDRFREPVYRYLARLERSSTADLDDLVQRTFLTVQRAATSYRGKGSVRSFILGIATNERRHHIRSEGRRRAMLVLAADSEPMPAPRAPDRSAEERQLIARAAEALERLPEPLREVFVLTTLEGLSGAEVASALGLRTGTVWRRLHDARAIIRRHIGAEEEAR
jgi:RNA polymerase sigma-70 factor (ECF subfamily)